MLTWPHSETDWAHSLQAAEAVYVALAEIISQYEPVIIVARDDKHQHHIQSLLAKDTPFGIHYHLCDSNDTWARDHGPISVIQNNTLQLHDFIFNGWGGKYTATLDTAINEQLFRQSAFHTLPTLKNCAIEMIPHNYVLEGGGIESDGLGTLMATKRCLLAETRNPGLTLIDNENYLKKHLGLQQILWLDYGSLEGDDTDSHIDTLARFISPTHILYQSCDTQEDSHFETLNQMAKQLSTFTQLNGDPYQLTPLPWPSACYNHQGHRLPATYANFLIVNNAILVPLYNVPEDQQAIAVFEAIYANKHTIPTKKVIGIPCRTLIEQYGSLHCITMNIMKPETPTK
jgi:agmatine deiminase